MKLSVIKLVNGKEIIGMTSYNLWRTNLKISFPFEFINFGPPTYAIGLSEYLFMEEGQEIVISKKNIISVSDASHHARLWYASFIVYNSQSIRPKLHKSLEDLSTKILNEESFPDEEKKQTLH